MDLSWKTIFSNYNLFFILCMVFYAARGNEWTLYLYYFNGNYYALAIPLLLTAVYINKNWKLLSVGQFRKFVLPFFIWWIIMIIKQHGQNISLSLFFFLQLCIAYCLCAVEKEKLFFKYEQIVTRLSIICLIVYIINIITPVILDTLCPYFSFVKTNSICKYNFFFASVLDGTHEIAHGKSPYRNPGFSWEPGMNACLVSFALMINLARNNFRIKNNRNFIILSLAVLSSFSTTGYSCVACCVIPFFLYNKGSKRSIMLSFILIPVVIAIFQLDFMGEKISKLQTDESTMEKAVKNANYQNAAVYNPQRFDAIAFEALNIKADPLLGYGVDQKDSYVYKEISPALALSNGILKLFAKFGLLFGLLIMFIFYNTSRQIGDLYNVKGGVFFFLQYLLMSISYSFFQIPLFLSMFLLSNFKSIK